MFGQDMNEEPVEQPGGEQSPMRDKLLQKLIEMLTQMPDKEEKPDGGALEIEIGKMGDEPKHALG